VCGLAGIFAYDGRPIDLQGLISVREAMHSRGPDGAGLWSDQESGIVLTHRRLAILDLTERGAQPVASPDGQLRVVFMGEIYNHPEPRAWCEARGARYISDGDTKTLLHLYAIEGKDFLRRCAECSRSRCGTAVNV
jgi:asparagine synthase (glutamine-hydrolysing)